MVERITVEQVRTWLDPTVVGDSTEVSEPETAFNLQLEISQLPLHVIKEESDEPLRIVGKCRFDTERVAALIEAKAERERLLRRIAPALIGTPGFYTFLDTEGARCEFADVHTIQFEQRIYGDGLSQHRLMHDVMAIAKGMRYVQNMVAVIRGHGEQSNGEPGESP